jgi:hypothetical protein
VGEDAPTQRIDAPPPAAAPPASPAPPAAPDPLAAASAGFAQRGALKRRLRKLRAVRSEQLVRLGTLVLDARKRSNGAQPEVVTRRAAEVAEIDRQVRELGHAVDPHADRRTLAAGVAGSCRECGSLLSTEDRFCATCGTPTSAKWSRPAAPGTAQAPAPPPTPGTAQAPAAPPPLPPPTPGTVQTPTAPPTP